MDLVKPLALIFQNLLLIDLPLLDIASYPAYTADVFFRSSLIAFAFSIYSLFLRAQSAAA